MIDADGSLGFRKNGNHIVPYISLITTSDYIKTEYIKLIKDVAGYEVICNRNKRDNAYNIVIQSEHAQKLINYLYYNGCLSLDRKNKRNSLC